MKVDLKFYSTSSDTDVHFPASVTRLSRLPDIGMSNRIGRGLWSIVWLFLYRTTPVPLHRWRCFLLRLFGACVAGNAHPYPKARIWAPWNLVMEEGSCIADGVNCYNVTLISIGADAIVSQGSYLCTASHDFDDSEFPLIGAPIHVGRGAWIAADAFVGPGVHIGDEGVVLARATVVRDVAGRDVVAGNPAKVLRQRRSVREPSEPMA